MVAVFCLHTAESKEETQISFHKFDCNFIFLFSLPLALAVEDTVLLRGRTRWDPGPGPGVRSRLVLLPDTPRPPSLCDWLLVREVDLGLTWFRLEMLEDLDIS